MQLMKIKVLLIVCFSLNMFAQSLTVYVDPINGNDSNSGTKSLPYSTISKALAVVAAGDTIFLRGGRYILNSTISISKSGTIDKYLHLFAYPGERPLLDFSSMSYSSSNRGILLKSSYWYINGLDVKGAGDNGMLIESGNYNTVEFCSFFENRDTGLQLAKGASGNRIINCDSYNNYDPPLGGNADGFAPKLDVGSWNYFYGCRAWQNSDDGWDGYLRPSNDITTVLENCWSFNNGYLKNGISSSGNGNGIKMGGSDNKDLAHNFILRNCLTFDNRVKGFDQNNNRGSMTLYNCTGFRNGTYNFSISSALNAGKILDVKNSVSLASSGVLLLGSSIQQANSWLSGFSVSNSDFVTIDSAGVRGPRKSDGSLPEIAFMHLSSGSKLIDAGVLVGIPFTGNAPDLGAFEFGMSMPTDFVGSDEIPIELELAQNYPNPFNAGTIISFKIAETGFVTIKVFDCLGREVAILINEEKVPGNYSIHFDANFLPSGIYFYRIDSGKFSQTRKMILMK
ncbi:MAG: hypothetical protein CVV24_04425 [Ignavibacteriae bacterium HGW-Ignavibacteriae-3]|nr:MAG: hypothetical protein CVV24_04425 [Ignavibacteriae bacterium HGW-Ignavibacteriae-3]